MKLFKKILASLIFAAAIAGFTEKAEAQGRGFDLFGATRGIVLVAPTQTASVSGGSTNQPIFIRYYGGIGTIDLNAYTNAGTNVVTVTPQTSVDNTNWSTLTNYAVATLTNIVNTNLYYAPGTNASLTNLLTTNSTLLPGVLTAINPATAGYAGGSYVNPAPYTNGGAYTMTAQSATIAFQTADAGTYLRLLFTTVGTNTYSAIFRAPLVNAGQ